MNRKKTKKMSQRGREQDRIARKREQLVILLIILIPLIVVSVGLLWGMAHPEHIYVIRNGEEESRIALHPGTAEEACEQLGFSDYLVVSEEQNGNQTILKVEPAQYAMIISKGGSRTVSFTECTVQQLLEQYGFTVDEQDEITPSLDTRLKEDTEITIIDVSYETEVVTEPVSFQVQTQQTDQLTKGVQRIAQYGVYGEKQVLYQIRLEDGEQVSKEATAEIQTLAPINCIIEEGTKEPEVQSESVQEAVQQAVEQVTTTTLPETIQTITQPTYTESGELSTAGRALVWSVPAGIQDDTVNKIITAGDGSSFAYTSVIDVTATAYHRIEDGGTITATGTTTKYGTIAVDPSVIPLGTSLYVVSDGGQSWSYGPGLAEDTGGLIKGNKIDLFFMTGEEATEFGVRAAKVYILKD